jgi:hypothetical protein
VRESGAGVLLRCLPLILAILVTAYLLNLYVYRWLAEMWATLTVGGPNA